MELADFNLREDDLVGKTFEGILILGRIGSECPKKYVAICHTCAKDPEIFGNGLFVVYKETLINGKGNCGCNPKYVYTSEQQIIRIKRRLSQSIYKFIGWEGDYVGVKTTRCVLSCPAHGEWKTTTLGNLLNKASSCPECNRLSFMKANIKPDNVMIDSFFASGAFHPETKFWRSDTLTKKGYKEYWHIECPTCGEQAESRSYHLQAGKHSCACSQYSQRQAYINVIMETDSPVALKFGIAKNSSARAFKQNKQSPFDLVAYGVWEFHDVKSCKSAERELKSKLICGVVSRSDFPDGFTETTYIYNLDVIVETYKSFGGVMISKINSLKDSLYA